jgi:flagellar hook-associated protein 1
MQSYSIALSSVTAAYSALDTVGNNIANAATEGYHRQRTELSPSANNQSSNSGGGGVDVVGVTRMIDTLLEREIVGQQSSYNSVSQQLSTMSTIESTLGEFSDTGGLNSLIDGFFSSLQSLSANPLDRTAKNEVISAGQALSAEFRRLGKALTDMNGQVVLEAQQTAESINSLTKQISELNGQIQSIQISGGQPNNLLDRRDQLIVELAKLSNIETRNGDNGVVDVSISGLPVVSGAISVDVTVADRSDGSLGVAAAGTEGGGLTVDQGKLGGLLALSNEFLPGLVGQLDTLAKGIIDQVNSYHSQGLGTTGSFTELTGLPLSSSTLAGAGVTDGDLYIRVTDTASGAVQRYDVPVSVSGATPDTLSTIAAKINALNGVSASVNSGRLRIVADSGHTFDFIPAALSEPAASTLTGVSPPSVSISGIYNGSENDTLTFAASGDGTVGNGVLYLNATNARGDLVATLNIGSGYAAGDTIEMTDGLKITVGQGDVKSGDHFSVDALASTDTSGLLVASGMNAFFSGSTAGDMQVCSEVVDDPDRIATAMGSDLTDNIAALKMSRIQSEAADGLEGMTPSEYYHQVVSQLSQDISLKQSSQDNMEAMIQSLQKQQSDISGVNVNDEAAQLLLFERMFQAAAKYLNSIQTSIQTLMDTI